MAIGKLLGVIRVGHIRPFTFTVEDENSKPVERKGMEIRGYLDRPSSGGQRVGELYKFVTYDPFDVNTLEQYLTVGRNLYVEATPVHENFTATHTEKFSLEELEALVQEMKANGETEKVLTFDVPVRQVAFRLSQFHFVDRNENAPVTNNAPTSAHRWVSAANAPVTNNAPVAENAPASAPAARTNAPATRANAPATRRTATRARTAGPAPLAKDDVPF